MEQTMAPTETSETMTPFQRALAELAGEIAELDTEIERLRAERWGTGASANVAAAAAAA
jgi:hypothetical protein